MQVYNHNDQIKALFTGNPEEIAAKAREAIKDPETKRIVIGNLPKIGDSIFINNLKFRVKAELSRNRFIIGLVGPADEERAGGEQCSP